MAGSPICGGKKVSCADGTLVESPAPSCTVARAAIQCQAVNDNRGCATTAVCPAGRRIVGARAACNLEAGTVSAAQLKAVPPDRIEVVRPSDELALGDPADPVVWGTERAAQLFGAAVSGVCWVGANQAQSGTQAIAGIRGGSQVAVGCGEYDRKGGGDCHIRGDLYCR